MTAVPTWRYNTGRVRRLAVFAEAMARTIRWCLRRGPGVVHVHISVRGSWYRKSAFVVVAKLLRRPVVMQFRSGPGDLANFVDRVGPLRRAWFRVLFRLPDRMISVSAVGAEELQRRYRPGDVQVVTNPAPPVGPPRELRDANGRPPELLFIGGFKNPTKGAEFLLGALQKVVVQDGAHVDVTLAGPGDPGPDFQRLIDEHAGIRAVGWLDSAAKLEALRRADFFVLPSLSEGMPNAMLEAMAEGCAVIASAVGAVPDVVTDGVDGRVVPPGDADALAAAIAELVRDPARRSELGRAGQRRVERLSRDEVYGQLDAIYRQLAA